MRKYNIDSLLFETLFTESRETFAEGLAAYFTGKDIYGYTVWNITGNICEPSAYSPSPIRGALDIFELGYDEKPLSRKINKTVSFFDNTFYVSSALFLSHKNRNILAITFHGEVDQTVLDELETFASYLGKRAHELYFKSRQMDLYVDYQKKVDFVKRASVIFKALELREVISVSLSFFIEAFSADAVMALHHGRFYGIGVNEKDIEEDINIGGISLKEYLENIKETEFCENTGRSSKFNIKNVFFVYEETSGIRFALFNILVDIVPDKDFSSLVGSIVSIAAENAVNHEEMTKFKVEETEITHTVDILNRFVKKNISLEGKSDIYAVNYPARNAGGDFVDVSRRNGRITFCIADVCGKGYSAAVFTVVLSIFAASGFGNDLAGLLMKLNKFLIDKNFNDRFITGFFGVADEKTGTLEYISCGHDPAAILHKEGTTILTSDYMPLGLVEEPYETKSVKIPEGGVLFAYTDGLIEYAPFEDLLCLVRALTDKPSKDIARYLYENLVTDRGTQRDDFTCVIMKM